MALDAGYPITGRSTARKNVTYGTPRKMHFPASLVWRDTRLARISLNIKTRVYRTKSKSSGEPINEPLKISQLFSVMFQANRLRAKRNFCTSTKYRSIASTRILESLLHLSTLHSSCMVGRELLLLRGRDHLHVNLWNREFDHTNATSKFSFFSDDWHQLIKLNRFIAEPDKTAQYRGHDEHRSGPARGWQFQLSFERGPRARGRNPR